MILEFKHSYFTYIFKINVGFWDKNTIFFDFYVL